MKPLIPVLAFCALAFAAFSPAGYKSLANAAFPVEHLKGKVKSVTTYTYDSVKTGRQIDSGWVIKTTELYNTGGKLTADYLQPPKHATVATLYQYDNNGRQTATTDATGKERNKSEYSINASGNLVQKQWYGGRIMQVIVYGKSELRDSSYNYDVTGKLTAKAAYHYDSNRNVAEIVTTRTGKQNLVMTATGFKTNDSGGYRDTYTCDKDHNQLSETRYDDTGKPLTGHRYTYDKYNNVLTQADSADFYIGGFAPYENLKDDVHVRTFAYPVIDEHGNWLQQDAVLKGVAVKTMKRKIEYYQ